MSKYKRARDMHQYYRDVFSQEYTFPDIGTLPQPWVQSIISSGSCDTPAIVEKLFGLHSGLTAEKDQALKLIIVLISQANLALDRNWGGKQGRLPQVYINSVKNGLSRVLTLDPNVNYLVIAAQLLYRLGEIEDVLNIAQSNPVAVQNSPEFQRILAMIHTINEDYEGALPYLIELVEDPDIDNHSLVSLMAVTCMHKLGGSPDSPIDFATLNQRDDMADKTPAGNINWLIAPERTGRTKPTVLVACDDRYFFEHALALVYSINETNKGELSVHLHCYNPNPSVVQLVKQLRDTLPDLDITATAESVDVSGNNARVQFACRRFLAADYLLGYFDSPLMIVDADCLFRKVWSAWSGEDGQNCDVLLCSSDAVPFWEKVPAGFVYLGNGDVAKQYIRETAHFIRHNLDNGNYVWFLDQVALSACFSSLLADSPAVALRPGSQLIDINHRDDSLSWVVTTAKAGTDEYVDYKRELLGKYGQIPLLQPEDAFRLLSQHQSPVYFLQVGAMDGASYDPIYPHVTRYGWKGVLVEPLPDMMERLQANYRGHDGLIFENVAVSDKTEIKSLYRVLPETIRANNLPHWLQGMSTFSDVKLDDYKQFVTAQPVSCVPLSYLFDKHDLPRIDVLQIDTEGFDYRVFKQFDFARYRPRIVNIEVVNLQPAELASLQADLLELDYVFYRHDMDLIALDKAFFHSHK